MPKLDLKKDLKHLYNPSAKAISVVEDSHPAQHEDTLT